MAYADLPPHPALRAFVDRFWMRDGGGTEPVRILPDGCIDLIVDVTRGSANIVGTMTRAIVAPGGATRVVGVRFLPGAASAFLGVPAEAMTDAVIPAGDAGVRFSLDQLADAPTLRRAASVFERELLARIDRMTVDPIVAHATQALFREAQPSIEALQADTGFSRQHLTRIFRRDVGVAPKKFARVARMQRAVDLLQSTTESLATIAARLGYFDQAHMALEFRELVGMAPSAVRGSVAVHAIPSLLFQISKPEEGGLRHTRGMKKLTPNLIVESIESSLPFWTTLGFEKTVEVPHGKEIGFVILKRDDVELMLQSTASLAEDVKPLAKTKYNAVLYFEVASLAPIKKALGDYPLVVPERKTPYGATELIVHDPDGNVVFFSVH